MFVTNLHKYQYALIIAAISGFISFSFALSEFTSEARNLLLKEYDLEQQIIEREIVKEQGDSEYQKTFLPEGKHSQIGIDVYLTDYQLQKVAQAAHASGNLTVNYLDSIGLSRARSEKLRQELARIGYAKFEKGQLIFTKKGLQSLQTLQ